MTSTTIKIASGTGTPSSLAKSEMAIRHEASNHTANSSSKIYFGEDAGDDGTVTVRQFGIGIFGGSVQSGVAIGETLNFSAGTGLDVTVSGTTAQYSIDLSEFADMTADVDGTQDELILLDNGAERRKRIDEIKLSQFNNDAGFVTSGVSLANDANNRVVTADGSGGINGEANLTFDGSTLDLTGNQTISSYIGRDAHNYIDFGTDNIIRFRVNDQQALEMTVDGSGNTTFKPLVDGKKIIFQQYDGNPVLQIDDNERSTIVTDMVVGDDIFMSSDGAVINLGVDQDVTLTHVADTGLKLAGHFLPHADDTYDLGASGSEWKDLYVDGIAYIDQARIGTLGDSINISNNTMTNVDINSGTIDATTVGANSASTGAFTTLSTTGNLTVGGDIVASGDITADVEGDLSLDVNGGDVFFKDNGTTFGTLTNNSGDLIIKSGGTTAATFSGDNTTLSGNLTLISDSKLYFRDSNLYINSSTDGQLDLAGDTKIKHTSPLIEFEHTVSSSTKSLTIDPYWPVSGDNQYTKLEASDGLALYANNNHIDLWVDSANARKVRFRAQGSDASFDAGSYLDIYPTSVDAEGDGTANIKGNGPLNIITSDTDNLAINSGHSLQFTFDNELTVYSEADGNYRFMIRSGSTAALEFDSSNNFDFRNGSTVHTTLDSSGNLTASGYVDAVNFKINGSQGSDGQVLTSTGSGVAWESVSSGSGDVVASADNTLSGDNTFSGTNTYTGNLVLDDGSGASPVIKWINGNNDFWQVYASTAGKLEFYQGSTLTAQLSSGGLTTNTGGLVISDGGTIGSASDEDAFSISSGGNVAFTQGVSVAGGLTANGNVDLGNATSDTITATGRFDSNLVPSTDGARDLGSSSLEWRDLYIDGAAYIDSAQIDALSFVNETGTMITFGADFDQFITWDNSAGYMKWQAKSGDDFKLVFGADADALSPDNGDMWLFKVTDGGDFTFGNNKSGSFVTHFGILPNATVTNSTFAIAGHATVGHDLTVSGDLIITGNNDYSDLIASDIPTLNQDTTGNAATATALATARNIAGQSFDGTSNISIGLNDLSDVTYSSGNLTISSLDEITVGNFLIDSSGDITLDADGDNIYFYAGGSSKKIAELRHPTNSGDAGTMTEFKLYAQDGSDGANTYTDYLSMKTRGSAGNDANDFVIHVFDNSASGTEQDGGIPDFEMGSLHIAAPNNVNLCSGSPNGNVTFYAADTKMIDFVLDSTPEMDVTGDFKIDGTGDITLDCASGSDVIILENGGTYTPTSDNHVATKKYVDDNAGGGGGGGGGLITSSTRAATNAIAFYGSNNATLSSDSGLTFDGTTLGVTHSGSEATFIKARSEANNSSSLDGPRIDLDRYPSSDPGADGDELGRMRFNGKTGGDASRTFGSFMCSIVDAGPSNSYASGKFTFQARINGATRDIFSAGSDGPANGTQQKAVFPEDDNDVNLGKDGLRWKNVYASTYYGYDSSTSSLLAGVSESPSVLYNMGSEQLFITTDGGIVTDLRSQSTSDENLKENITANTTGLSFINQLTPKNFTWKQSYADHNKMKENPERIGWIAQDVEKISSDYVEKIDYKEDDTEFLGLTNKFRNDLIAAQINAIKELSAKNDALEARIAALEAK